MQSKHSSAKGDISGGNRNNGARNGTPCHLTKSACGVRPDERLSDDRPDFESSA